MSANQSVPAPRLAQVTVGGFKCFRDRVTVPIAPLTILAGANSSGKSSLLQALLLLRQSADLSVDPGPINFQGVHASFTSPKEFLWRAPGATTKEFTIGLGTSTGDRAVSTFRVGSRDISISSTDYSYQGRTFTLTNKSSWDSASDLPYRPSMIQPTSPSTLHYHAVRFQCFLTVAQEAAAHEGVEAFPTTLDYYLPITFTSILSNITHLPGLRLPPARKYPTAVPHEPAFLGPTMSFQDQFPAIIAAWVAGRAPQLSKLQHALHELELTWGITAFKPDFASVELRVGRTRAALHAGAKDFVNVADVGLGIPQVLPVLVALLSAPPGRTVYIEQPETHLHPRAQVRLARIIAETVSRGVQVILETHSPLLLISLQHLVAADLLLADKVILHWFRRGQSGESSVSSAPLDAAGSFGEWPEDFADTLLQAEREYSAAAFKKVRPS